MLTIVIPSRKLRTQSSDGRIWTVYPMLIRKNGRYRHLQDQVSFPDLSHVRLVMRTWRGYRRFPRNKKIEEAIKQFLATHQVQGDLFFDCYAFATFVHRLTPHPARHMMRYWKALQKKGPELGDVAIFFNKAGDSMHFCHAAMYIGFNSYLSV